ncbi:hypothetical protein RUM43_006716 [Polyplax serrata]|uniref:Uncharacterized protein n=1 Tax=Polyplax serrata TaxID=468196 RepID=A0AAN8PD34_POLSC
MPRVQANIPAIAPTSSISSPSEATAVSLELPCRLIPGKFSGNWERLEFFTFHLRWSLVVDHQKRPLLLLIMSRVTVRAKRQLLDFEFQSWDELKERMSIVYLLKYACGLIGAAVLLNYSTNNSAIQPVIRKSMLQLISQSQNDSRAHTLRLIQESIGCCGADGANDYLESRKPLPPECRDSVTGHTYFHGCVDELTWFLEEKASWLAGVTMFLCFFDVSFFIQDE